jgi:hypothetical protein
MDLYKNIEVENLEYNYCFNLFITTGIILLSSGLTYFLFKLL